MQYRLAVGRRALNPETLVRIQILHPRKVGREADCTCPENRKSARAQGFESLTFLQGKLAERLIAVGC